jgi:hypothetical protein
MQVLIPGEPGNHVMSPSNLRPFGSSYFLRCVLLVPKYLSSHGVVAQGASSSLLISPFGLIAEPLEGESAEDNECKTPDFSPSWSYLYN